MSWKTVFVTERLWREVSTDVRRKVLKHLARSQIIDRYAVNIAACLPKDLADEFTKELQMHLCNYYSSFSEADPRRISHEHECPFCSKH